MKKSAISNTMKITSGVFAAAFSASSMSGDRLATPYSNTCAVYKWQMDARTLSPSVEINRLSQRLEGAIDMYAEDVEAVPIGDGAISHIQELLMLCDDALLKGWTMFSNDKGALTLEYKAKPGAHAVICVGNVHMTCFAERGNDIRISMVTPFSVEDVVCILKKFV